MAKKMECRSVGLDCDFVARGENEDEIMHKVGEHAKAAHGMTEIPPDVAEKVRASIHEDK
jgi:predicted small metal-binding protein